MQREETNRIPEKTLRSIFDSSPMMMGIVDVEGDDIRHISENKSATVFFKRPTDAPHCRLASEMGVPKKVVHQWVDQCTKAEANHAPVRFEYWHPLSSGERYCSVTVNFIDHTPQGHSRFTYVVHDTTKARSDEQTLKQANELLESRVAEHTAALIKSQQEFETLANNISQLTWMTDEKGWIFWYNQKWFDYTGTTLEQMEGWGWKDVHHPDHIERVTKKWEAQLQAGTGWEDTFPLRGKDGSYRWFLSRALPIRDKAGSVLRWFGTNTDITEQKEAVQARDEFLAIASHELKTPLTSLKIHAEFMRRSLQKGDEGYSKKQIEVFTDHTEKQVIRLERLVGDMLDIARVRSGKLELERERFDLCELVRESVERMHTQFHAAGCGDPKLVFCETAQGHWDRRRIEQVLNNLFTNGMKYGNRKPLEIAVERFENHVRLSVKDQGIGIAPEAQAKIFNCFEQIAVTKKSSGLGLGLFIAREIVSAHGGKICVESKLGEGATFFVELPNENSSETSAKGL